MLRVGIDLTNFKKEYRGGINSFALGLLKSLEKEKVKLIIFTNKNSKIFLEKIFTKSEFIIFSKSKIFYLFFQFIFMVFNDKKNFLHVENLYYKNLKKIIENTCDIYYCPLSYLRPYNLNIPTLSSIHDLQHLHYPEYFNFLQTRYRNFSFEETIKKSTIIQASSNFIKKDILTFYKNINKKKIKVIQEGVSSDFSFKRKKIYKKKYIFFPAQLWQHKNHLVVLNAIRILNDKYNLKIKIILVGEKFKSSKNIVNFILENKDLKINYLGKVNFKKLLKLYENSKFLISPAIYESSSIPILEACKIGVPVICSNSPPNKELGKQLKLNFFKTDSSIDLANLIRKLWKKHSLLNKQINNNKKSIKKFDWNNIAKKYYIELKRMKDDN